jgi:signal transduction histidine kinase
LARISNQLRLHRQERELETQTAELRQLASQLEQANTELRELSQRKSEFVGIVSHDLRTPLAAMITLLDNLLSGLAGSLNEKQEQYLIRIKNNGWRLVRMINDLLDIAKIESGAINFDPTALDLAALLENLVDGLRSVTQEKGIRLQALVNGPAWSKADSDKLHQVFTNLIDNATKFTKAGGAVRVELKADREDFVQICVSDTGCGISSEDLPHVFEKFYRGRDRHSARGAGLGLAIVKHYVELHGGRIWVESVPGEGSRFYVEIPRVGPAVRDS